MDVRILGITRPSCKRLEESTTRQALVSSGLAATVSHTRDAGELLVTPFLSTPALVIDGRRTVSGRLPCGRYPRMTARRAGGRPLDCTKGEA